MLRHLVGLCAAAAILATPPALYAAEPAGQALTIKLSHTARDTWRVDYHFQQAVTAVRLDAVGDYRGRSWKMLTPHMQLKTESEVDIIAQQGRPFRSFSVEVSTFEELAPKAYAPFNRFSDGGTAVFLGHLQGKVQRGAQVVPMLTDIHLSGMGPENVIAPPLNRMEPGGTRGYAYFGPAKPVSAGKTWLLLDPQTPLWARETLLDAGARLMAYYEQAYQHPLKDALFIVVSVAGVEAKGLSMKGGAVLGQLSYRFEGQQLMGDHPKKREYLTKIVAHEMAHLWQLNVTRGGIGEADPWIHEGGADAMALDALLQTGLWDRGVVDSYRAARQAICDKLGDAVDSYDGIYACGLARFDKLGVGIVPLWRNMIAASDTSGAVYSPAMIASVAADLTGESGTAAK